MEILINNQGIESFDSNKEELVRQVINYVLEVENVTDAEEVSILITDNSEIQKLNLQYRNIDAPTDVLSFPMDDQYLGDIVISIDKVFEQAIEYGHTPERELAFLVVHGMLHLFGYDHIEDEDRVIMRQKEEQILNDLGLKRE